MTTTIETSVSAPSISKARLWTSRIMGGLVVAFMLMDSIFKFFPNEQIIAGSVELGFQAHHIPILGALGFISTLLFIIPRTQIIGAILLTAYFGGAIATHLRLDNPLFTHILFTVYFGILVWGSLFLKNEKLRKLILNK